MVFLIESMVLCVLFTAAVVPPVIRNPIGAVHDYPPAIAERAIELGLTTGKHRRTSKGVVIVKAMVAIALACVLAIVVRYINRAEGFLQGALISYGLWMVINWFDALVLDCLWFCHSKRVMIPGTEDMKEYKDYLFHIKAGCIGSVIGIPVAILVGCIVMFLA